MAKNNLRTTVKFQFDVLADMSTLRIQIDKAVVQNTTISGSG